MEQSLQEKLIIQSLWLERFKGETNPLIIERLEKASKKINATINSTSNLTDKQRFTAINQVIAEQMNFVYGDLDELLFKDMEDITETSYNATATLFNTFVVAYGVGTLTPLFPDIKQSAYNRILDKNRPILGNTLKDMKANTIFSANKRLRETIANSLSQDQTLSQAVRNVQAIQSVDEVVGKMKRYEINALTNTALTSAIEESKKEVYRANTDISIGWERSTVFDSRTSPICASLGSRPEHLFYPISKYPTIDDVPYQPPLHPHCRTKLRPKTRFDDEIQRDKPFTYATGKTVNHRDGTKSTKWKTKEVKFFDSKLSFAEAFSKMPVEFQKDFLGKGRYALYEKHGAKVIKNLFDLSMNQPMTIAELKAKLN